MSSRKLGISVVYRSYRCAYLLLSELISTTGSGFSYILHTLILLISYSYL